MSKLTLNTTQIASLVAARSGPFVQSAQKAAWSAIRSAFSISPHVRKLGVEIDETGDPNFGAVYDKYTRQFLLVSPITGRFSGLSDETKPRPGDAPDPVAGAPAAAPAAADVPVDSDPNVTPAAPAARNIRGLTVIRAQMKTVVYKVSKEDLLFLLRDEAGEVALHPARPVGPLPAGMPEFDSDDIVVDNATGDVYFRGD
ncbi:MAG: hypothetical protein ACK54C_01950 [Betaproteobacteria bacterium]